MVLVAVSWVYILFAVLTLGTATAALFGIRERKLVGTAFLGLFTTAIIASFWAFFGRINIEFHVCLLVVCGICFFSYRNDLVATMASTRNRLSSFPASLKMLLCAMTLVIIGQSAAAPFVLDNESYYIQTIKWLNEYGFVKGLANLHLFLAQNSGWHIAQSAFSFSFLYRDFNDLSGFCLLLGNLYGFLRLDDFLKSGDRTALVFGLLPVLNVFLLRFSGAPSPDIAVYVISFIVFDHFIKTFASAKKSDFNFIVLMILFIIYCKASAITLAFLPIVMPIISRGRLVGLKIIVPCVVALGLFIAKNCVASGYPLFPLPHFGCDVDFALPHRIAEWSYTEGKIYGYRMSVQEYNAAGFWQLLKRWLTLPGLHGFFNSVTTVLVVIAPFFIRKFFNKKPVWMLYIAMVLQLALLFYGSPQYRFFLNFTFFFSLLILTCLPFSKKIIVGITGASFAASLLLLLVPIQLDSFTDNRNLAQTSGFRLKNLVVPYENSKLDVSFQTRRQENLIYHSPVNPPFFWATGDGDLPCVNNEQLEFFDYYFHYYPQMRSKSLKDGFYAKPR